MPRFAGTDMDTEAALGAFSGKQTVLPNSLDATDAEQLAHRIDALLAFGIRQGFYGSWMTSAQMPFGLLDNDGRTPRTSLIAQLHRWWVLAVSMLPVRMLRRRIKQRPIPMDVLLVITACHSMVGTPLSVVSPPIPIRVTKAAH